MVAAASDTDYLGNPVTPADADAHAALNDFIAAFLSYEAKAGRVLRAASSAPGHVMLNAYAASLCILMETPQGPARAKPFLDRAKAAPSNAREAGLVAFVETWIAGDEIGRAHV